MPSRLNVLKKATIETMGVTPRRDGKVEIILRVLADHEGLTDCAAKFIRAGCESFKLFDVFKVVAPTDDATAPAEPLPAPSGLDFSPMRPFANDNVLLAFQRPPDMETLMELLEVVRQEVLANRKALADALFKTAVAASFFITASFAGRKGFAGLIDLTALILA